MSQNSDNRPLSGTEPGDFAAVHMHFDGEFFTDNTGYTESRGAFEGRCDCPVNGCRYTNRIFYDTDNVPYDVDFCEHAEPICEQMEYIEMDKILFNLKAVAA